MVAGRDVVAIVMAGSVAAVLAACGSSGSKTVPKSQIISKGDAICRRLDATIGQPPNFNPANATTAQLKSIVPFLTKTAQVTTSEVQQVRALGTPSTERMVGDAVRTLRARESSRNRTRLKSKAIGASPPTCRARSISKRRMS